MRFKIEGAVVTHAGMVRPNNEDNYYLFGSYRYNTELKQDKEIKEAWPGQEAAAVFDGMGGENAGEVASLIAAKAFMPCSRGHMQEDAICQMKKANEDVCKEMRRIGQGRIGTTVAAVYIDDDKAMCCNVGDSRCYLMRDGVLRQLSEDHSEARQMIEMGILSPEKARQSKSWHKLTQHLGIFPEEFVIEPYVSETIPLKEGDIFLLCSDGLTDMVMDEEISDILGKSQDAEAMADELTQAALANGGKDNVTAMVLKVKEESNGKRGQAAPASLIKILGILGVLLLCVLAFLAVNSFNQKKDEDTENVILEEEDIETVNDEAISVPDDGNFDE